MSRKAVSLASWFYDVLSFVVLSCLFLSNVKSQGLRPPVATINLNYLRFDFITPGARASSLGGAFIGAAQDETAAAINPAGLTYLSSAGASLHQRNARKSFREPEGSPEFPNSKSEFSNTDFNQSMVSAFFPFKKLTVAIYHQVLLDSRFSFETQQFFTFSSVPTTRQLLGGLGNFPGKRTTVDVEMINDGLSIAYPVSNRLSLGVTGRTAILRFNLNEEKFLDVQIIDNRPPRGNSAETTFSLTTIDKVDVKLGFSAGIMYKLIKSKLYVGAVYHHNPTFNLNSHIFFPKVTVQSQTDTFTLDAFAPESTAFKLTIPDKFGTGLYYVVNKRLRFMFDLTRVTYSDLLSGNPRNISADDDVNPQTRVYEDPDGQPDLTISDITEIHAGIEYLFKIPRFGLIPIRFGVYSDPAHQIHATKNDPNLRRLFPKGDDRVHVTFGGGFVLNSFLKFDASIDLAKDRFEMLGSALLSVPFN